MAFSTRPVVDGDATVYRVIERVAEQTDTDPLELPPLYRAIDPDALNTVIDDLERGNVSFRYAGRSVTVHADGTVAVSDEPIGGVGQVEHATDD